jgi:8-oxo-dGTP diphosphatase
MRGGFPVRRPVLALPDGRGNRGRTMRRYGERVRGGRIYRDRPGVYAILPREGRLLLTHQAEPVPEYQLPGGGIDPGEPPLRALFARCWRKPAGRIAAPRRLCVYQRFTYMPEYDLWARKLCHIYVARPALRHGPPAEAGHQAVWMDAIGAVGWLGSPGDRAVLAGWLRRQAPR